MTPASFTRGAFVALLALIMAGNALAQDEMIEDLPEEQQDAVEQAVEEAKTPATCPKK